MVSGKIVVLRNRGYVLLLSVLCYYDDDVIIMNSKKYLDGLLLKTGLQ